MPLLLFFLIQEYARIKSGETLDLIEKVVLKVEQIGEETIKIITSTQPIDISLLEQSGLKGRGIKELNPLERLLTHALHGQRGDESIPTHEQWTTAQVTFEVK